MLAPLTALAMGAVLAAASPLDVRQTTCATGIHFMAAGGCAKPCTVGDSLNYLSTLYSNVSAVVPGTDLYLVPYTGSSTEALSDSPVMVQAAQSYAAACPNTPIVFAGYSLGGIIVMNTLCGANTTAPITGITSQVIAGILYGEETYVANQSYDKATCMNNAPSYARSPAGVAGCAPFVPIMQSYCNYDDPACCAGGLVSASHFSYGNLYDVQVTSFILSQYNNFRASHATTTSTSSTSTSTSTTTTATSVPTTPPNSGNGNPYRPGSFAWYWYNWIHRKRPGHKF